ncbi:MAG: hypothetical protein ACJAT5_000686 [Lentimonas sp.]|jgi:hypothetical protein
MHLFAGFYFQFKLIVNYSQLIYSLQGTKFNENVGFFSLAAFRCLQLLTFMCLIVSIPFNPLLTPNPDYCVQSYI